MSNLVRFWPLSAENRLVRKKNSEEKFMKYFPEKLTVKWISSCYDSMELTPLELIEEIIRRSEEEANKEKNVWIVKPSLDLIAPYLERLGERGPDKPLWGIPFAIKDNIDLAGVQTSAACPDFAYVPSESATVVKRLVEAGAVPVGKTNLDQFATGLVGTRSPYGECHNAYQDSMISGGSSSGSAVSVALGLCAFALGTDTAGSGRVPAMLNSIVGFKPSRGAWSTKGVVPACQSLDCVSVFSNSLDDAVLVDSVARSYDIECAWSRKIKLNVESLPKKIYLPDKMPEFFGEWKSTYEGKWESAVFRIRNIAREKGIKVQEIDISMFQRAALILYEGAYVAERWADLKDFVEGNPGKTFPVTEKILRSGAESGNTASKLFSDLHELELYRHLSDELLDDSVLVLPTAGGSFTREQVRSDPVATNSKMGLYTNHCNLLDMAAIAVPENRTDREYPFGVTIFARHDSENLLFGFAREFLEGEGVKLAVCGLHKKGRELESQIVEIGGVFLFHGKTSDEYGVLTLDTLPPKPGLFKVRPGEKGSPVDVDVYLLPKSKLGFFMDNVLPPHAIGSVTLEGGEKVKGFVLQK